jgi:hypothetical protein
MMKIFLSTALMVAAVVTASAQITLTTANSPIPNIVINNIDADSAWSASLNIIPAGGAGLTWNFSNPPSGTQPYPTYYLNPSATPFAADYPTANLAFTYELSDTANYNYLKTTSSAIWLLGSKSTSGPINYTSPVKEINLPFAYQNTFSQTDTVSGMLQGYNFSGTQNQTTLADAWGTILTPLGTFQCLRLKRISVQNVTVFIFPAVMSDTTYEWWAAGYKAPVFIWDKNHTELAALGISSTTLTTTYLHEQTTGTTDPGYYYTPGTGNVYPNPAHGLLNWYITPGTTGKADILLYSMDGKLVRSEHDLDVPADGIFKTLNVENLRTGNYRAVIMLDGKLYETHQVMIN